VQRLGCGWAQSVGVDEERHALLQLGGYGCSSHTTQGYMWLGQVEDQGWATGQLVEGASYGEQQFVLESVAFNVR
jgi:hypothetical protein